MQNDKDGMNYELYDGCEIILLSYNELYNANYDGMPSEFITWLNNAKVNDVYDGPGEKVKRIA